MTQCQFADKADDIDAYIAAQPLDQAARCSTTFPFGYGRDSFGSDTASHSVPIG